MSINTVLEAADAPQKRITFPMVFGLDIGIASVGWCVMAPDHMVALGVRAFDKAETSDKGESLNLARRTARLARRRLYRRAWRLVKVARLLKAFGLVERSDFFEQQPNFKDSTWQLRVDALDRELSATELARVIYHLCKHRGFHWVSKAEERAAQKDEKEGGRVTKSLAAARKSFAEVDETTGLARYRTVAEMLLKTSPGVQRNKAGDYARALPRALLDEELVCIFEAQQRLGNPLANPGLLIALRGESGARSGLFWNQKPALSGEALITMIAKCTFEPTEYRAPKASYSAQRHVWLTQLNNLRIIANGQSRPLTPTERAEAINLPFGGMEDFKFAHLRKALEKGGHWTGSERFAHLTYKADEPPTKVEAKILCKLPAWNALKATLMEFGCESSWQAWSRAALAGEAHPLDEIAWVLSVYKEDDEVHQQLTKLGLDHLCIAALQNLRFDKFHNLSVKALRVIIPHMERGLRYDEAVAQPGAYGHHSALLDKSVPKLKYLPPLYEQARGTRGEMIFRQGLDVPRNPVVLRALNQARKVVNALVHEYGAPASVHIEVARDLSRPLDERRDIEKLQKEYADRNQKAREEFAGHFGRSPRGAEFEKFMLYREQHGKCAYSLTPLDLETVIADPHYTQIDHALPYSRSYDDSKLNKVLALTRENQDKGNRTPYEYLGGERDSEAWQRFEAWVAGNKSYRQAKRTRLLRKSFGKEDAQGFRDRNLNDTRYICKFFKNYVDTFLQLAKDSADEQCVVVNGQLTSFLRARWGLVKVRSENDRHHALDAAVVAACSRGMVKRLADHSKKKELQFLHEGFVDPDTGELLNPAAHRVLVEHFPEPWPEFRKELLARLQIDDAQALRDALQALGHCDAATVDAAKPLFVSRAPQRRNGGAAHKDTIYAQPERLKKTGGVTEKIKLEQLTMKDLDRLIDPGRNVRLYAAIRERMVAAGGKGDKAFGKGTPPLLKPGNDALKPGPIVRTVTAVIDKLSGIPIRGGIAKNDTMLRVDVFTKAGKFHLVPVYVHHMVTGLPNRAVVAFKDEVDWTEIDESFEFLFSLHANDLVFVQQKGKAAIRGYFGSAHRGTGSINLWAHDRAAAVGKGGEMQGIGVKTALSLEKLQVDILGNIHPAKPEKRRGLA